MSIILYLRRAYRRFLPLSIRKSPLAERLKNIIVHNWHSVMYDRDFFEKDVEKPAVRSAGPISESIFTDLKPLSVVDVGCGTGALLEALRRKGCKVFGLEYSNAALSFCRERNLDVLKFDLEKDVYREKRTFDVTVSLEVAEHLPEKCTDRYLDLLTSLSDIIVFTAAPPGQGGHDHVNEQPRNYWITKFQQRGFGYDRDTTGRWSERWGETGLVESWYYRNLMIFRRQKTAGEVRK